MKTSLQVALLVVCFSAWCENALAGDVSIQIETTPGSAPEFSTMSIAMNNSTGSDAQNSVLNSTLEAKPLKMATTAVPKHANGTKNAKPKPATLQIQSRKANANATLQTQTQTKSNRKHKKDQSKATATGRTTTTSWPTTSPAPTPSQTQSQSRKRRQAPTMDSANPGSYGMFCDGVIQLATALGIKLEENESGFASSLGSVCISVDNLNKAITKAIMNRFSAGSRMGMNIHLNSTGGPYM